MAGDAGTIAMMTVAPMCSTVAVMTDATGAFAVTTIAIGTS